MSYLLDTHTFLWAAVEPKKLPSSIRSVLSAPGHKVSVSTLTLWEISIKYSIGKLELKGFVPDELSGIVEEMGLELLLLEPEDALTSHHLPRGQHKDPFDRMLVWQCIRRQWTLLSIDKELKIYQRAGLKLLC